ncbi:hypothetical protein FHX42_002575 [Saccharopolyspora lacisalsi]|uniref:Peptidase M28 domain-containing protein n=1 Tax=Halosaccharopolyspora lacisalsi TaxID=1000566 RepID=A0A839DUS0_9PSEU|nr:M28 family peptidase [Halosaccharopolyspora lacisalsi]MBA8825224.1 hypothetical protein [Halosaccharopolyspora lacisalsi]
MSTSTDVAGVDRPSWSRWLSSIGLACVLLIGVLAALERRPVAPRSADAPASEFSAERAMDHIGRIADAPRPLGSAAHAETREYLLDRLDSWGWNTGVRRGVGATPAAESPTRQLAAVSNVVATMPGTDPTGTVVLAAHYDSVPGSPGAADDGIGVGTLLETARALSAGDAEPRNTVTILLTDAEELGLLGAEAFVRDRAAALGATVLLNHEARGNEGVPMTFRTTSPNGALMEVLSHAPGVVANSAFEAAFEALPNDTDVTRFAAGGLHSYDTAITGGGAYYHTPLDTPERLSRASLRQMGRASLAMTRVLAGEDLATVPESGADLVITTPWGPIRYPRAVGGPLAWATLVLAGAVTALSRRRRTLTLPRTVASVGVAVVALAASGAAAFAVWQVALAVDPGQASVEVGAPYRPEPYRIAMLLAGLGVTVGSHALLRRGLGSAALATGGLLALSLLGVLATLTMPGASSLLAPPVLPVVTGALVTALMPRRWRTAQIVVTLLALVPAALLLGPNVLSAFDVGLAMGGTFGTLLLAIFAWLALPVIENVRSGSDSPRPRTSRRIVAVPALGIVLVTAVTATGLVANRAAATPPRQERILYSVDADTGRAHWASPSAPDTAWSRSLLTERPAVLDEAFPRLDGERLAHGPAPVAKLPAPELDVVTDRRRDDGTRELTLRLSSKRGVSGLGLWIDADQAAVRAATVAGRRLVVDGAGQDFGFVFDGAPGEGVDVRLVLDQHRDTLPVRIDDRGHDLRKVPDFTPPADRVLVEPVVTVTRTRTL